VALPLWHFGRGNCLNDAVVGATNSERRSALSSYRLFLYSQVVKKTNFEAQAIDTLRHLNLVVFTKKCQKLNKSVASR